jgi:hypothetical protein
MVDTEQSESPKVACDAMCGGLARWLRMLGVDATFLAGVEDAELLRDALREGRIVVSSDHKLFERRVFTTGEIRGLLLPVGLRLLEQVTFVVRELGLRAKFPRCATCNGELQPVSRQEVADVVPARSLVWVRDFFRCRACGKVFWEGSHWRRIREVKKALESAVAIGENPEQREPNMEGCE